ncbi:hypothetical protein QN277_010595 [Acacia crassicarpa]|uniref:PHD finger protein ALFIN-LIKE n=1 Tax=Acacia crassicarpa TaxID=499986 RepID=A0AAE1MB83_9FABA|nr:hypothetical protein QN277_010595 [Acacia crassicarpa]
MATYYPRTVEEIFKDYSARREGVVRALTHDVHKFYRQCDPDKDNLCLYGHPNETWEVTLPPAFLPHDIPEPALGINFARQGMQPKDWLSLVAAHSDSWLHSVAFYFGALLNRDEREQLFKLINADPTVFEVVTEKNPLKDKATVESSSKPRGGTKRTSGGQVKNSPDFYDEGYEEDHSESICGICENNDSDDAWISCDSCSNKWFHEKCVKSIPIMSTMLKRYNCPSCSPMRRGRP